MSSTAPLLAPAARGRRLDVSPEAFGFLRDSGSLAGDPGALRERLQEDGYLFVPGLLDRDEVRAGRADLVGREGPHGALEAGGTLGAGEQKLELHSPPQII